VLKLFCKNCKEKDSIEKDVLLVNYLWNKWLMKNEQKMMRRTEKEGFGDFDDFGEEKQPRKKGKPRIFDLGTKRWRLEC